MFLTANQLPLLFPFRSGQLFPNWMEMGQETILGVPKQGHGFQRALAQQEWEACASGWPRLPLCTWPLRRVRGAKPMLQPVGLIKTLRYAEEWCRHGVPCGAPGKESADLDTSCPLSPTQLEYLGSAYVPLRPRTLPCVIFLLAIFFWMSGFRTSGFPVSLFMLLR